MEGEEGDDVQRGGPGSDFIDAADDESPGGKDRVKCGGGLDDVMANENDVVADDCEKVSRVPNP
jgi:hypothetical protein